VKLLVITTEFPPKIGGIGKYAYNMCLGLKANGWEITTLTSVPLKTHESITEFKVYRIPKCLNKKYLKIIPLILKSIWILIKFRPDKILALTWTHEGIVACLLKLILKIEYALVVHGSEILMHRNKAIRHQLMIATLKNASQIVVNSRYTHKLVAELGFEDKDITVINPPIVPPPCPSDEDWKSFEEKFSLAGKRVLLTVSRMTEHKGHLEILLSLAQLKKEFPDILYVMTGSGEYLSYLQKIILKEGLEDFTRTPGFISEEEVAFLFHRCEIYVSPSYEHQMDIEGFGMSFAEASACEKPVIGGNSGGVSDAILDGKTGLLVPAPDINQLQIALEKLLRDEELQNSLGREGKRWAETAFSPNFLGKKMTAVLQKN